MSPITAELAQLVNALRGRLGSPSADRLLGELAAHLGGHAELVDEGGCALCAAESGTLGRAGEVLSHLRDAGSALLAAATALLPMPADDGAPGAPTAATSSPGQA